MAYRLPFPPQSRRKPKRVKVKQNRGRHLGQRRQINRIPKHVARNIMHPMNPLHAVAQSLTRHMGGGTGFGVGGTPPPFRLGGIHGGGMPPGQFGRPVPPYGPGAAGATGPPPGPGFYWDNRLGRWMPGPEDNPTNLLAGAAQPALAGGNLGGLPGGIDMHNIGAPHEGMPGSMAGMLGPEFGPGRHDVAHPLPMPAMAPEAVNANLNAPGVQNYALRGLSGKQRAAIFRASHSQRPRPKKRKMKQNRKHHHLGTGYIHRGRKTHVFGN